MSSPPPISLQIPFTSFDKAKSAHVYAIRCSTKVLVKRRFREFVALRDALLVQEDIAAMSLPHLPSKVFGTDAESRRPKLEAWLNAVLNVCVAAGSNGSKSMMLHPAFLAFVNVPSTEALVALANPQPKRPAANKKKSPESRTSMQFALSDPTLLVVYALSLSLLAGFVFMVRTGSSSSYSTSDDFEDKSYFTGMVAVLPFISSILLCAAAFRILTHAPPSSSAPPIPSRRASLEEIQQHHLITQDEDDHQTTTSSLPSKDHSILPEELPLLESLRERLSDFMDLEVSKEFDEAWLKTNQAVVNEWPGGAAAAGNALQSMEKRKFIWTQYGLVDRRLVQFIRSNHGNLVLAETEAREAFTARVALRMDWVHEYYTPPQWLVEYASCPVLNKYIDDREGRLANFWARDKDGSLAVFNRAGPMNSLAVVEKLKYDDAVLVQALIWYIERLRLDFDAHHDATQGDCPACVTLFSDMTGFALSEQVGSGTVLRIAQKYVPILSKTYNGVLKRVIVFNAPWFVNMLFAIIKPFVPAHILACISINGSFDADKHVRPFIEAKYTPKIFGGDLVGENGDETCKDRMPPIGPWLADKGASLLVNKA